MMLTTARRSKENAGQSVTRMPARQNVQKAKRHIMLGVREPEN